MKPIGIGTRFKDCDGVNWKVYTKVGDYQWSCLSLTDNSRPFTMFTETQIQEYLNTGENKKSNNTKRRKQQ